MDHPAPVDKDGVAGLDAAAARGLESSGVARLDALAAAWSGLVAAATGASPDTGAAVVREARGKVRDIQGTVRMFSGVTADTERALRAAGVTGPPDLANA